MRSGTPEFTAAICSAMRISIDLTFCLNHSLILHHRTHVVVIVEFSKNLKPLEFVKDYMSKSHTFTEAHTNIKYANCQGIHLKHFIATELVSISF